VTSSVMSSVSSVMSFTMSFSMSQSSSVVSFWCVLSSPVSSVSSVVSMMSSSPSSHHSSVMSSPGSNSSPGSGVMMDPFFRVMSNLMVLSMSDGSLMVRSWGVLAHSPVVSSTMSMMSSASVSSTSVFPVSSPWFSIFTVSVSLQPGVSSHSSSEGSELSDPCLSESSKVSSPLLSIFMFHVSLLCSELSHFLQPSSPGGSEASLPFPWSILISEPFLDFSQHSLSSVPSCGPLSTSVLSSLDVTLRSFFSLFCWGLSSFLFGFSKCFWFFLLLLVGGLKFFSFISNFIDLCIELVRLFGDGSIGLKSGSAGHCSKQGTYEGEFHLFDNFDYRFINK